MSDLATLTQLAIVGAVVGLLVYAFAVIGLMIASFHSRYKFNDDADRREKVVTWVTTVPRYVAYETDWRVVAKGLPVVVLGTVILSSSAYIFYVGVLEVFGFA